MKNLMLVIMSCFLLCQGGVIFAKDRVEDWSDHGASMDESKFLPDVLEQLRASYPEHIKRLIAIRLVDFSRRGVEKDVLGRPMKQKMTIWTAYESNEKPGHALVIQNKCFTYTPIPETPLKNCFQPESLDHAYLDEKGIFHWFTPLSQLPDQSEYGIGGSGTSSLLLRSLLSASLVLSGLLLLSPVFRSRVPASVGLLNILEPLHVVVGLATMTIGIIFFFTNLFSPLANILPLATAVIAGLILSLEFLIKQPDRTIAERVEQDVVLDNSSTAKAAIQESVATAAKAADVGIARIQGLMMDNQDIVRRFEKKQIQIGIACLIFGLLHLVIGGAILV